MATTKKTIANGKRDEVLVNFFTQQVSPTHLQAMELLLTLKYPIEDYQNFIDQVNNCKDVDTAICQMLISCFTPTDFTIATPQSGLEKFRSNVVTRYQTVLNQVGNTAWNTATPNAYNTATGLNTATNMPNVSPFGTTLNANVGSMTNTPNTVSPWGATSSVNTPFGNITGNVVSPTSMGMNTNVNTTPNTVISFGNDACGMAAAAFFCNCVMQGVPTQTAFFVARDKEIQCRNIMPSLGNTAIGLQAQSIFAQQYILFNLSAAQCTWCANFFIQCCGQNNVGNVANTTTGVNTVASSVTMSPITTAN